MSSSRCNLFRESGTDYRFRFSFGRMLNRRNFRIAPLPGGAACRVTRRSVATGKPVSCDSPLPPVEMRERMRRWREGEGHVQEVFRMLTADYREFLISGIPPGEWDQVMGTEEAEAAPGEPGYVEEPAF